MVHAKMPKITAEYLFGLIFNFCQFFTFDDLKPVFGHSQDVATPENAEYDFNGRQINDSL